MLRRPGILPEREMSSSFDGKTAALDPVDLSTLSQNRRPVCELDDKEASEN